LVPTTKLAAGVARAEDLAAAAAVVAVVDSDPPRTRSRRSPVKRQT